MSLDSSDLVDSVLTEQARLNSSFDDGDINNLIADYQAVTGEKLGFAEAITAYKLGWRQFAMRYRLIAPGNRDFATRFRLGVTATPRDFATRFRLGVGNYRDFALRYALLGHRPAFAQTTASGTGTTASVVLTPLQTLAVGDLVVIALGATISTVEVGTNTVSVTDAKGNTWTGYTIAPNGFLAEGVLFVSVITTALLTSDTITVNTSWTNSGAWNAVTLARQFFGWPSAWTADKSHTGSVGSSGTTSWSSNLTGVLTASRELILAMYLDDGASGTPTATAPAQGVASAALPNMLLAWKTVAVTTSTNISGTRPSSTSTWGSSMATFR